MACFARRGFHHATMHDISAEAQISVGLIYRYFANKEAVISAMADEHLADLQQVLATARNAPGLFEALAIVFTCHCKGCEGGCDPVEAAFVTDLFAEAARNGHVAALLRQVNQVFVDGVTQLIAAFPESQATGREITPRQAAELLVDTAHGLMLRAATDAPALSPREIEERQVAALRRLCTLLFPAVRFPGSALGGAP